MVISMDGVGGKDVVVSECVSKSPVDSFKRCLSASLLLSKVITCAGKEGAPLTFDCVQMWPEAQFDPDSQRSLMFCGQKSRCITDGCSKQWGQHNS
jgi:hypothetical protein